jgi:SH3-like domain-containing protein
MVWEQGVQSKTRPLVATMVLAALALGDFGSAEAQQPTVPYWASLDTDEAIMRRGPSRQMRAMWQYVRAGLPLKVLRVHEDWRQVQDPDGTVGWMHVSLITGRRTAIVIEDRAALHRSADASSPVEYRAERGVVGRISDCSAGWCLLDVLGRRGYIPTDAIWGDDGD